MSSPELGDTEKEQLIRRAAGRLFLGFFRIGAIGAISIGAAILIVWLGTLVGLYTASEAVALGSNWIFLLVSSVAAVALWLVVRRRAPPAEAAADEAQALPYGTLDRALHRIAFAAPGLQKALADVETSRFSDRIDIETAQRPVFVTSLARAGTTILLETLAAQREFASATYRHMPFTLAPLLWSDLTKSFQKDDGLAERAHGDGLTIGFDSPEAFEEMVWMAFWKGHYRRDRITAWSAEERQEAFEAFFRRHRAKIVASQPGATRYLSKNNTNIARLGLLEEIAPDASIVIPVRDPLAHAASLLRQHRRFTELHAREPFGRRYMEGIGHFEFGAALRPIVFEGDPPPREEADHLDHWLRYWADTYENVLATAGDRAIFVDHDALSAEPARHLLALADALALQEPEDLVGSASRFRPSRPADPPEAAAADRVERTRELHARLSARCLTP
nr:sulfotransferase [Acuticoccus kalidii]